MPQQAPSTDCIIVARSGNPAKGPRYFAGYRDHGDKPGTLWTDTPKLARVYPQDEAITEAKLLAPAYPTRVVAPLALQGA